MIRVDLIKPQWELVVSILENHSSGYLAKPIIGEIKNQIIRQDY